MTDDEQWFGDLQIKTYEGYDTLVQLSARADRLTIVSMLMRAGGRRYIVRLEHEYFTPMTPANKEYDLHFINWLNIQWAVVMVPLTALENAEKLAAACAVRLAKGAPLIINHTGSHKFPVWHDRVRVVENIKDSRVYGDGWSQLMVEESQWLKEFWRRKGGQG